MSRPFCLGFSHQPISDVFAEILGLRLCLKNSRAQGFGEEGPRERGPLLQILNFVIILAFVVIFILIPGVQGLRGGARGFCISTSASEWPDSRGEAGQGTQLFLDVLLVLKGSVRFFCLPHTERALVR